MENILLKNKITQAYLALFETLSIEEQKAIYSAIKLLMDTILLQTDIKAARQDIQANRLTEMADLETEITHYL